MENNLIAGAALDVFDVEPLPKTHRLREFENVLLTGHTGFVVKELHKLVYGQAVENIDAWLKNAPLRILNDEEGKLID